MVKHTEEPWFGCCNKEDKNSKPHFIFSENAEKALFKVLYNDPSDSNYSDMEEIITIEEAKANSRRVGSCINACVGMDDPEKEINELKEIKEKYLRLLEETNRNE